MPRKLVKWLVIWRTLTSLMTERYVGMHSWGCKWNWRLTNHYYVDSIWTELPILTYGFNSGIKKLADFCYKCGRLGQSRIHCTWEVNMSVKQKHYSLGPKGYGPWMQWRLQEICSGCSIVHYKTWICPHKSVTSYLLVNILPK